MSLTSSVADHGSFETRLSPQPASVAEARALVRGLLLHAGREDLVESAVLLVSEMVTNALLHAGTEIDLRAGLGAEGLRVEIGDGSPHLPSRRRYAATSGTGRGLLMLESMVDDWGVTRHREGKTVWFSLSGPDNDLEGPARLRTPSTTGARRRRDNVAVELRNVPLLLHAAWQEHAEALLREYLLASLDVDGEESIQMHAEATDAIAVIEEHLPRAEVMMSPEQLMRDASEPRVSADCIEVPVPVGSVPHFATLDRAIEAALDLTREGLVLTPPTQPEVQAFRRWLCRQVLRQASGGRPEPWRVPEVDDERAPIPDGWDPRTVTDSGRGLLAADSISRLLAVSPEAARILGYDEPAELEGNRIVSIIPERYRQAHVAGFTMYLLVGRKPLLDRRVTVPALRRDGSEVTVELTVSSPSTGISEAVLVAEIRPVEDPTRG